MKKLWLITVILFCCCGSVLSQGNTMFQVLQFPVTAYDAAVANTFISGENSSVNNPAVTPFADRRAVVSHAINVEDTGYTSASVNLPAGKNSAWNISLLYFNYGSMARTVADGDYGYKQHGTFSADDKAICVSYGKKFNEDFSCGISVKYVNQTIDDVSYSGLCFHLSALYFFYEDVFVATGINNLGADVKGYSMPSDFYLGVSGYLSQKLLLVGQFDNSYNDDITNLKLALEYETYDILFLRFGYIIPIKEERSNENEYITNLTCGLGLKLSFITADYAWLPQGDLGDMHMFSLSFNF